MQLPLPARLHEMLYVLLRAGAKYEGAGFSHTRFSLFDANAGIIHWIDVCSCNSFFVLENARILVNYPQRMLLSRLIRRRAKKMGAQKTSILKKMGALKKKRRMNTNKKI